MMDSILGEGNYMWVHIIYELRVEKINGEYF